jgi:hypothetical protein
MPLRRGSAATTVSRQRVLQHVHGVHRQSAPHGCIAPAETEDPRTRAAKRSSEALTGSVQHNSTAQHNTAQHSTAQHSTAQHSTAQHSTAQHSTAQHSTAAGVTSARGSARRRYTHLVPKQHLRHSARVGQLVKQHSRSVCVHIHDVGGLAVSHTHTTHTGRDT